MFFRAPQINMGPENGDTSMNFTNLLLEHCQRELLKDRNDDEALINGQNKLGAPQNVSVAVADTKNESLLLTNTTIFPFLECFTTMLAVPTPTVVYEFRRDLSLQEDEHRAIETKARRRSLGLKRFIGELFKLEILNEPIMHECLEKLLNECLCKLLSTCGKRLDTEEAKVSTEVNNCIYSWILWKYLERLFEAVSY